MTTKLRQIGLVVIGVLLMSASAFAQPAPATNVRITAGLRAMSCSRAHVQLAIDTAGNGQTVSVPPGTCLWTTTVTIPHTKGIVLQCAGATQTIIRRSGTAFPNNQYRLLDVKVAPGNALTRVTGCTWDQDHPQRVDPLLDSFTTAIRVVGHGVDRLRIDHNVITGLSIGGVTIVNTDNLASEFQNGAELSGLIDQNTIRCDPLNDGSCHSISMVASPAWDTTLATSVAAGWGRCFTRAFTYASGVGIGSNRAIYVEDNTFDNNGLDQDGLTDSFGCVQLVFRFNAGNGSQPGNHGFDSAGYRAPRWMEVYRNALTLGADNTACGVFRGGGVLYFDNGCDHPTTVKAVALQLFRARPEVFVTQCDGSSPLDGNLGTGTNTRVDYPSVGTGEFPGWPCVDQTGWMFDEDVGAGAVPFPGLFFNNDDGAGGQVVITNYELDAGNIQNYLKCNRDYYIGNSGAFGSVTEGDCATGGVKRGTLAARPGTCTTGVFYWATDQGTWNAPGVDGAQDAADEDGVLYRCIDTNTWATYYIPYSYPHPLRSQ